MLQTFSSRRALCWVKCKHATKQLQGGTVYWKFPGASLDMVFKIYSVNICWELGVTTHIRSSLNRRGEGSTTPESSQK